MSVYFVDTSALAKRYIVETGAAWVQSWSDPSAGNTITVSEIVLAEMVSLFARRVREGMPLSSAQSARITFFRDLRTEYQVIPVRRSILLAAGHLCEKHALRTLDAIHLAAAIQAQANLRIPIIFVTADKNQQVAVSAEGFTTDDPNEHP